MQKNFNVIHSQLFSKPLSLNGFSLFQPENPWAGTTEADTAKTDHPDEGGSYYEQARSVFVKDSMVYTAGGYSNVTKQIPCYWRGAEKVDLQDGVATMIFVP